MRLIMLLNVAPSWSAAEVYLRQRPNKRVDGTAVAWSAQAVVLCYLKGNTGTL